MAIELGALEPLVQKAILDSLTDEAREKLIADAISYLVTPAKTESWRSNPTTSPLQDIFSQALTAVVRQIATEVVTTDPRFDTAVRSLVGQFITALPDEEWETTLMEAAATAVIKKLKESKD